MKHRVSLLMALTTTLAVAAEPSPNTFTSKATGTISIDASRHAPLFVEFDRSPAMTSRLAAALAATGVEVTSDRTAAKSTLTFRGDIALLGGPMFYKGVKVAIGDATERALAAAPATITPAEAVQTAAGLAVNNAALRSSITPFWRGMALSGMASALGDATGAKGSFNKALTGDPRGICLSRCDQWNKVNQTAYVSIGFQSGEQRQEVRVLTHVASDSVVVEQLLDRALGDALTAVSVDVTPSGATK